MKHSYVIFLFFVGFSVQAQIVDIPDANFKDALVNGLVVDTDFDGIGDSDVDTNNDGEIQLSEAEVVIGLYLQSFGIISLEGIQSFVDITYLDFRYNHLVTVDLSQNLDLIVLYCTNNDLTSIDVSSNLNLVSFYCGSNSISSIDISNNLSLRNFSIRFNNLTEIDVAAQQNLWNLDCTANYLTQLDVTNNIGLSGLHFGGNDVSEIDITQNLGLNLFTCSQTKISELDLSQHSNLSWVQCYGNERLNYLNIRNGNNTQISIMWADQNPNLECILVDDPVYSSSQVCNFPAGGWCKDEDTIYNEDCILGSSDFDTSSFVLSPNPVQNKLRISGDVPIGKVRIYSLQGSLISVTNTADVDVSQLAPSLYFAEITTKDGRLVKKFIKL